MDERGITTGVMTATVAAIGKLHEHIFPFMILGILLIITDMKFGISAARRRKEDIRISKAVRRSINKFVDYTCWIFLAAIFGQNFGEFLGIPSMSVLIIFVVYGVELVSCFNNYFESRGIKKKINVFKLFGKPDLEKAFEDISGTDTDNINNKNKET